MFPNFIRINELLEEHAVSLGKYDLKTWNETQMRILVQLSKLHMIDLHSMKDIVKFGALFSNFFDEHERVPTISEMEILLWDEGR